MTEGEVFRRIPYLALAIERGTPNVPGDGRFYVTEAGQVRESCASLTIAETVLEMIEEEILEANPNIVSPREKLRRERQTRDIISARVESAAIGKSKATAKGGKGGRSGV